MYRKDYIMRMIEQMAIVLHQLVGLRAANDHAGALKLLDGAYRRFTRFDGDSIRGASAETLVGLMSFNGDLDIGQCVAVAELMKEEGAVYAELGDDDAAFACFAKSFGLFDAAVRAAGPELAADRRERIDALVADLDGYELDAELTRRIFQHYAATYRLDRAEDWLFRAIGATPTPHAVAREGVSFYERLLGHADAELEIGGLSRAEVAATLDELRGLV